MCSVYQKELPTKYGNAKEFLIHGHFDYIRVWRLFVNCKCFGNCKRINDSFKKYMIAKRLKRQLKIYEINRKLYFMIPIMPVIYKKFTHLKQEVFI